MNVKYIVSDYLLVWNLLYKDCITEEMKKLKEKVFKNYKNQYNDIYEDKELILKDGKNFIPNNDTIYNIFFESKDFIKIKKDAEKERINALKLWDKNSKNINKLIKKIIRKNISDYVCFVVNKEFDVREIYKISDKEGRIFVGKNWNNDNKILVDILYQIMLNEITIEEKDNAHVKDAIIEMAVLNEFATEVSGDSCYRDGNSSLYYLKKQIYPYWLMYLGISKEDMVKYMERDKIDFEVNGYAYEKELVNMNLDEFIDFVIRNKKYIIKIDRLTLSDEVI